MLKQADPPEPKGERPIGELVHQLFEDGKAYTRAEIGVAKAVASDKVGRLKVPVILMGVAYLFMQGAATILGVALFLALLPVMGPLLAGVAGFVVFAGIAVGLGWQAVRLFRQDP